MSAPLTALIGAVAFAVVTAGGYVIGASAAPDEDDAAAERHDAQRVALRTARVEAFARAAAQGRRAGVKRGRPEGQTIGAREGGDDGAARAAARLASAQAEAAASEPAPGTPGSTVCVAFQDYVPGVGCVPPVAPGETAAPIECPPGQVPVGVTGACGRP